MSDQQSSANGRTSRGLTTVALLKVQFDAGSDHIEMFIPFILDVINARGTPDFSLGEMKADLLSKHGLDVPINTLQTLLTRVTRRGFVRREAGRYLREHNVPIDIVLQSSRATIDREHAAVAKRFRDFASSRGVHVDSDEDALALILAFLEQNQVTILLEPDPANITISETLSRRETVVVAQFLQDIFRSDPQFSGYLERILGGLVLQNALLLKDISLAGRRFSDLEVYLDTGFLLRALGLCGEEAALAARETLDLLRRANARLSVFENTIGEIRRILHVYQSSLGSSAGIRSLRQTEVTRYFLTSRYTPSDVAVVSSLLEKNIRQLGMTIRSFPKREAKFTLDETDLSKRLRGPDETDLEPRVMHDVDCVAAILTLRAGHRTYSLDDARAVFATTTGLVVKTVSGWYRAGGESGILPVVHILGLSNVAWLKRPASAPGLKLRELVALCAAALHPGRKVWESFLRELRKLENTGQLSSDEAIAIVASELIDGRLADVDDDADLDSETVAEVVERVKASYGKEWSKVVEEAERAVRKHEEVTTAAKVVAERTAEERRQIELRVRGRADLVAGLVAAAIFWIAGLGIAVGVLFGLPGMFPGSVWWYRVIGWIVAIAVAIFSIANLVWGTHLAQLREELKARLGRLIAGWLLGEK